jgi:bifunctional non-homologous end joining protein LigD
LDVEKQNNESFPTKGVHMKDFVMCIEDKEVPITNANKLFWPGQGITKLNYMNYLLTIAPYMLPYTRDRMLMIWRYPDGIGGKRIEQRSIHGTAPTWVPRVKYNDKDRILLNDAATLVWAANLGALELHVPFDKHNHKDYPTELVFDLDPADDRSFELVIEVALKVRDVLASLSLASIAKTSGATGLQIYVPITPLYTFEETRKVNRFIADYMIEQIPQQVTLDRVVERRGSKLYFDYLQLWKGRTMAAPYSVRAREKATVSTPVTWEELQDGIRPSDFTISTVPERIRRIGDLFAPVSTQSRQQDISHILNFLEFH